MDDTLELKEELSNITMLANMEEKMQAIEKILEEHGHTEDMCASKIAEVLGVSSLLPEREEVSPAPQSEVSK
tara:strand:+ start:3105 stop:3320 length:216 start_codon:yes stop_codon:yes gene_type:complete